MGIITIPPEREKPIRNQHPWIFSGAISKAQNAQPADIVTIVNKRGEFLARGYWNPKSQIQVRILTWQDEPIDERWWHKQLTRAIASRNTRHTRARQGAPIAYRLINAENDYVPGLIADYYAGWVVMQALTLYIDQHKIDLAGMLADILRDTGIPIHGVYERSDVDARGKEGLKDATGVLWGSAPPDKIEIYETAFYYVDVYRGHKTGFYLDQQSNRRRLHNLIDVDFPRPCELLNVFSYTGGFSASALSQGGVHAVNIDTSGEALAIAAENFQRNNFHLSKQNESYELIEADAFDYLRYCVDEKRLFDVIVLDPPKFAYNKQQIEKAARGYKDLNMSAFKLIRHGGYLMTFSCSGAINRDLFQKIVFGALADSGRQAQILEHLGASDDHPIALTFPEGEYLKGLLLKVY